MSKNFYLRIGGVERYDGLRGMEIKNLNGKKNKNEIKTEE
jgi:hypothetical protein